MKILSGVYTRDSGELEIFGKPYGDLNPKLAQSVGVAIIHQELNMCRHLSVAENMFLGREKRRGILLSDREMEQEAGRILQDLKIDIDPKQTVGSLPVSKQQMVEIAKALSTNARILIMDEPTSALTAKEIDELFRIIRQLKAEGHGIVYISHRPEELQHIVDRVTIMRDGQYITSINFADTDLDAIIAHMVGREIKEKFPRVACEKGRKVFEVKNLNAGRMVRDVSFEVYEGEIVGFAGLMGAGRTETTRAIFGVDPKESGAILLDGQEVHIHKPEDAMCGKAVEDLKIKTPNVDVDAANLSGGNQQKVVVGKWIARNSRVVIFDEPTRGIDVAANGPDAISSALKDAQSKGVKIVYVDSPANVDAEATFSTDNKAAGTTAGQTMIDGLKAAGVESGSIGIISVNNATASTVARDEGFRAAFEGTGFTLLETQFCEGDAAKAQSIAENFITEGVVGIYGCNEGSTTGAGNAIKASGKSIVGVGFDKSDAIMGLINDGYLLATMAQNPDVMGYEGVKAAVSALKGESLGGKVTDTGVSVLTK